MTGSTANATTKAKDIEIAFIITKQIRLIKYKSSI